MGNITGDPSVWEDLVYQFETTDVVQGGPTGIDNVPLKQLANRTSFLKNALRGFEGITDPGATHTLTYEEVFNKLVIANANGVKITLTLPYSGDVPAEMRTGLKVVITALNVNHSQVTIACGGSDIILNNGSHLHMGDSDLIELILLPAGWILIDSKGNFEDVGGVIYRYKQIPNTAVANGQLLERSQFPRLWEYAQSLVGSLIDDFTWNNVTGYKGFFSTGNDATTFRVPDLRSMFVRGLDLGAGIALGRNSANPGGYESDELKSHTHAGSVALDIRLSSYGTHSGNTDSERAYIRGGSVGLSINSTGGSETRPKNIGLLPLIKI